MHRPTALDWISRVIMLVLSGMITLSIIGSIAAIPAGIVQDRIAIEQAQQPIPAEAEPGPQPPAPDRVSPEQAQDPGQSNPQASVTMAPAPPEEPDAEDWLEAITYALLALVGLAALATFVLWRCLEERRRIADALQAMSFAPRS